MNLENLKAALTTSKLTKEQKERILIERGVAKEQAKQIVATRAYSAANVTATTTTNALTASTASLRVALKGLWNVAKAHPIMAIITVVSTAVFIFQKFHKTSEELREEYDKTASEIETLNGELETTGNRIKELQKLSDSGKITLIEQEELDKLKETNFELERAKRLKEDQAAKEAEKTNKSIVKNYNRKRYVLSDRSFRITDAYENFYEPYAEDFFCMRIGSIVINGKH